MLREISSITKALRRSSGHSTTFGSVSRGSTPAIVGSRVHQQSESGMRVLVSGFCASTLQVGIREIHSDGEGSKLARGVMGTGGTRDSNLYHPSSTRCSSSAHSGFMIKFHGTDSPAI